jgi:hypothetical protein
MKNNFFKHWQKFVNVQTGTQESFPCTLTHWMTHKHRIVNYPSIEIQWDN